MLKVFRRIRQNLLHEGKFKRYLFYAVGEILLVVIGILIALQINNWNENQKDRKQEADIVSRLKKELEENIKMCDEQIKFSSLQTQDIAIIFKALRGDTIYENPQPIAIALEHLGKTYPVQFSNNVWIELINSGSLRMIEDNELREQMANFQSEMSQTLELQKEFVNYNLGYKRLTGDVLDFDVRLALNRRMHPLRPSLDAEIHNLPDQMKILDALTKLKGLNGFLTDIQTSKQVNGYIFTSHKNEILELIQLCDRRLGLNAN